ncbi:MAG TPA: NAD-binding protein [Chthoniobacterales bacterium]|nr:NAD-binding protein [Chthoniobacterales bacterium]
MRLRWAFPEVRMKFFTSQLAFFLKTTTTRRNIRLLLRFVVALTILTIVYTVLFHVLMVREGQQHSWVTGLYWTLTVMSTLGFGDITFKSDLGRIFSIIVLLSGMVSLLMLLPFTFIEFFYAPWMRAQSEARARRRLPESTRGHVILTNYDPVSIALIQRLKRYGYSYALLVGDLREALRLYDLGVKVVFGDIDRLQTYERAQINQAAMVAATGSDVVNTNVAFTVRELSGDVPIVVTANSVDAVGILGLAGSTKVIQLAEIMGQALARRITGVDARAHIIGQVQEILIAEATAAGTPLVGKTLAQSKLRQNAGVTVIGLWRRGNFEIATAQTQIDGDSVMVLGGSAEQLRAYDELFCIYHVSSEPVVIIGAGRVGRATARALEEREVDYRIVETNPDRIRNEKYIHGSAADLGTLEKAGIRETSAVVITTHDDDTNVYLTLYCRKLRPDVQIISRATLERNVSTLHRAGADFVLSYASMGATMIFNVLRKTDILVIAEGLHVAETEVPQTLVGKTLAEAEIPHDTQCNVIALRTNGELKMNPAPDQRLSRDAELLLICTTDGEQRFVNRYGSAAARNGRSDGPRSMIDKLRG